MSFRLLASMFAIGLADSIAAAPAAKKLPVDEVPMYGGVDRRSIPELKKTDDDFIERTSSNFGGREQAAKRWVEQGFAFYNRNDLSLAMRRFNQAWLLDPKNPEVYWGFGAVLHDRGQAFGAYEMEKRAYDLGLRDAGFLADFGRVAILRVVEAKDLSTAQRNSFVEEAERYYAEAEKSGQKLGYVYDSWATAKYWCGDYVGAWDKVRAARTNGAGNNPRFMAMLKSKMPEPNP
jgi:tetratricopeptide (TPR) repeat protein